MGKSRMPQTVLLADIDNTLYDWPAFFAPSFRAMIHALSRELAIPEDQLYEECKAVFVKHNSLEYAFVIQELESVRSIGDEKRIGRLIEVGRGAFNSVRKRRLTPYEGVVETLQWLNEQDVVVIGITNSPVYRAQHRLYDLKLDSPSLLGGLVAWEGFQPSIEDSTNQGFVRGGHKRVQTRLRDENVYTVPLEHCKPNERHYMMALEAFGSSPTNAWAIGDSLAKDLEPAARLGIRTIWARYGSEYDPSTKNMATLLRITHWDSSQIQATYQKKDFTPNEVVDSFDELKRIMPVRYPTLF